MRVSDGKELYADYIKRAFDLMFGLVLLFLLCPLLLLIGLAIIIESKGKAIFKQERLGLNGKVFIILKYRTMINAAEQTGSGIFTSYTDPRITKLGRILRATSLDELPQLINIIKGDMSFVGPRPPVTYHPKKIDEYSEDEKTRFKVRPGVTGYAQVVGRNTLSWAERIHLDTIYVKHISPGLDAKIILITMIKMWDKRAIFNIK